MQLRVSSNKIAQMSRAEQPSLQGKLAVDENGIVTLSFDLNKVTDAHMRNTKGGKGSYFVVATNAIPLQLPDGTAIEALPSGAGAGFKFRGVGSQE